MDKTFKNPSVEALANQKKIIVGGLCLPAIGLGTMGFGGYFKRDKTNFSQSADLIRHAYAEGIRVIDTAEGYGEGCAEEIIGSLPVHIKNDLFIMSKFSPQNSKPKDISNALEKTLKRLGRDYIDVYQPHWPSVEVSLNQTMEVMIRLKEIGKIRHIGVSNFPENLIKSQYSEVRSQIEFIQTEFNPIESSSLDKYKEILHANNGALVAYSPFREGKIFKSTNLIKLKKIAENNSCTVAQLILMWVIRSGKVLAIPKSLSLERIKENAGALKKTLNTNDFDEITKMFIPKLIDLPVENIIQEEEVGIDRKIYFSLSEAIENRFRLYPGPNEIAAEIAENDGKLSKPIKVKPLIDGRYALVEGRLRYWAWRILHKDAKPISSVIMD